MKRTIITIVGATAALSLAACGSTTGSSSNDEPRGTNTSSDYTRESIEDEAEVEADTADEAVDEVPAPDEPNKFGSTYTYDDGISIHVSELTEFTPNEWAAGGEGYPHHVLATIRVVNNSGAPFDASMVYPTVASGSSEGDSVYDSENGIGGPPETTVLDGREVSWKAGFGVEDPSDIVMELEASWDHAPAIFATGGE